MRLISISASSNGGPDEVGQKAVPDEQHRIPSGRSDHASDRHL